MALAAANEPVDPRAVDRIVTSQIPDGSWGFAGPGQPGDGDANTTGCSSRRSSRPASRPRRRWPRATGYLKQSLAPGGGFVYAPGQEDPPVADANSTALAVQALLALDEGPAARPGATRSAGWRRFQNASGAFRWKDDQPDDNLLASVQAIAGAGQLYLPFRPEDASGPRARRAAARPTPSAAPTPDRLYFPGERAIPRRRLQALLGRAAAAGRSSACR